MAEAKLFAFLIFVFILFLRWSRKPMLFAAIPPPWRSTGVYISVVSAVKNGLKHASAVGHIRDSPSPPLPWTTKVFIYLVSLLTDAVRRCDGTVRRFICRLDVTVGADATPKRGVSTADVTVNEGRGLWFRLFLPETLGGGAKEEKSLPVIVFFHGGGFAFLSPATRAYDAACRRICREVGAAVVSVNYRLAPEHRCPAAYDDGMDVLRFLDTYTLPVAAAAHESGNGGNPSVNMRLREFFETADLSSCFVAGDSAGANIAHHVARRWTAGDAPPTRGNVRLEGLLAIQPFFGGEERVESELRLPSGPLVNTERTDWLWRAFLPAGADRNHEGANPAAAVAAGLGERFPRSMVVVGGFDPLQDWQRRYHRSLRKHGKEARLVEYSDAVHGFYMLPGLEATASPLMEEMRKFVHAPPPAPTS